MKRLIMPSLFWFGFVGIILIAFFVRVINLQQVPAGFFGDEASIAYNAYSIMTTGRDDHDVFLPIFFQSFGDYKNPLFIYSAIPFIKIFGLTEFAVRFESALFGIITIIFLYVLAKEWFSRKAGLVAALVAATMPWLLHYNRIGFELNAYAAFFTATVYLFVKAVKNKFYFIPAFLVAGITLYTYQPPKLLIPLLLFGLSVIYWKPFLKNWQTVLIGFGVFCLISIPLIVSFFTGQATARFNDVSILSKDLPWDQTALLFFKNYSWQFMPQYFIVGEGTFITRHFINGLLPVLPVTLPFVVVGILACLWTVKKKSSQVLLYWLLLYPIAGAVTADPPFTGRSVIGAPLVVLLITYGIYVTVKLVRRIVYQTLLSAFIVCLILGNFMSFLAFYFVEYPKLSSDFWGWQYGPREIMRYFVAHEDGYDELIMSTAFNEPDIFVKFYAPNECKNCHTGDLPNAYKPEMTQLFAIRPEDMLKNQDFVYEPIKTIYYPDGKEAFVLTTVRFK